MTTLISGGANGADSFFYDLSKKSEYNTIIYRSSDIKEESYNDYDKILKYLNNTFLHRKYPTKNEYINNLLRRDMIVSYCDIMYAVSWLEKDSCGNNNVHGGTAWAFWAYCSRMIEYANKTNSEYSSYVNFQFNCYLFDQKDNIWYRVYYLKNKSKILQNCIEFVKIDNAPLIALLPEGIKFAGIGTRELNDNGKKAIELLFE